MRRSASLLTLILCLSSNAYAQLDFTTLINPACADFKVLGSCSCTNVLQFDQVCTRVSYHQPKLLIETVPIPGDTYLGGILSPALLVGLVTAGEALAFAGGSGAAPLDSGHNQLSFREAHVFTIPPIFPYGCNACDEQGEPEPTTVTLNYASELDFPNWRYLPDGIAQPLPIAGLSLAGVWGSLYPRTGKSAHDSPPVAAALMAWRAATIAYNPAPGPGGIVPHTVLQPAIGIPPVCFQCAKPTLSKCGLVGMNPLHWQLEKVEPRGRNVFILWERRICCVDPSTAACGLAGLAVTGGGADNFCDIPYDPVFGIVPGMPIDIPFDGH